MADNTGASQYASSSWMIGAPQYDTKPTSSNAGNVYTPTDADLGGGGSGGYGYGYGYGGYGGGGGGGDTGPTKNQVDMAKILGPITDWNNQNLLDKAKNAKDVYDNAAKDANNNKKAQWLNAERKASLDWHPLQTQLQRVRHQLRLRMGNAAYGSSLLGLNDDTAYQQDVDAQNVLNALDQNIANIDNEYLQTLSKIVNGWNEFAMDTQDKARQGVSDYILQLANIHPDLATGQYKGTSENKDEGERWYESIKLGTAKTANDVATTGSGIATGLGGNSNTANAIKSAGATENIVDSAAGDIVNGTAGGSINVAPWLQTGINFYNNNKMGLINYAVPMRLSRASNARWNAIKPNDNKQGYQSSANERYWRTMSNDYAGSRL